MTLQLNGDPTIISQMFPMFAWLNSCAFHKGISEFKIRVDNTDKDFNLSIQIDNKVLNEQFEQFCSLYNKYNTIQLNPIFHLGLPYGIINEDVKKVKKGVEEH